jgi:prepilin-type N-terminal cleavage/methylation domain-containing protein/prepilin-type processing-associated H-X9-DG protein
MKLKFKSSSLQSFTLVELLVVIGIIAILSALGLAGMSHAIRSAHFAASISNVRQIGVGIIDYANDNDSQLPTWYNDSTSQYWWQTLAPYLGAGGTNYNAGVYRDPGDSSFDGSSYDQLSMTISYGYNYLIMGRTDEAADQTAGDGPQRLANLNAGSTLAVADGQNTDSYGYIDPYGHGPDTNRYQGLTPALFLDGHVETMTIGTNFNGPDPYFAQP